MTNLGNNEVQVLVDERHELAGQLNEALRDWVFGILSDEGFDAYDVECEDNDWSIRCRYVSFRLSGVWGGWKFGLWLFSEQLLANGPDNLGVVSLFVQHETLIDKFKPSYSPMCVKISRMDFNHDLKWPKMDVLGLVRAVRDHPVLVYEGVDARHLSSQPLALHAAKEYAKVRLNELQKRRSHRFWLKVAKIMKGRLSAMDCVEKCVLEDCGEHRYPPISLDVIMKGDLSDDDVEKVLSVIRRRNHGRFGARGWETLRCDVLFKQDGEWMRPDFD